MSACPYCGYENIDGVDQCEACELPLTDLHLPDPATMVERHLLTDRVSALDPKLPHIVAPETPVREALRLLVEQNIGCVLVGSHEQLVGIFSERDALMKLNTEAAQLGDQPVSQFMTPDPDCLQVDAKIAFAVHRMDLGRYRHVPIVDTRGRPTGIVSVRDILRYLGRHLDTVQPS